jgi:hypothetical protein
MNGRDALFVKFMQAIFLLLFLYGAGTFITVLFGDYSLARVMLTAFASMFAGTLGFGSGYLLGRRNGNNNHK